MKKLKLTLSIVSHRHMCHVCRLLDDIARFGRADIEVILTLNVPEQLSFDISALPFRVRLIENAAPKGFAANHNSAFLLCKADNFVVLNPDVRLTNDPFDPLLAMLSRNRNAIVAPLIVNGNGQVEDSARKFPTPFFLLKKAAGKVFKVPLQNDVLAAKNELLMPDWVAGMFIVVPCKIYAALHGLSEHYFLYYEDVDFCARARLAGFDILVNQKVKVIHQAQRDSHRNARYLLWHMQSAARFFTSDAYLKISLRRMFGPL
jgi:N-acetylglucosaminyl-diphospho-decaprenol L-rhamnosyltransferase